MALALRLAFVLVALFAVKALGLIGVFAALAVLVGVEAWRKRKTPL